MSRKQEQKAETGRRMLAAAGRGFRGHGYAGVGVDGIAREAGATSGAFYAHFGSKDGAFAAALEAGLDEVIVAIPAFRERHGAGWVEAFADYYLGRAHRDDRAGGCAMTALSPDIARADSGPSRSYEAKMSRIADLVADGLAGGNKAQRRARAWAMLGTLIGGLTVARAVDSEKAADEIATALRLAAIAAAGQARQDLGGG